MFAIFLGLLLSFPLAADEPDAETRAETAEQGNGESEQAEEDWSVTEPPGEWQTISIDTRSITWADVDISPDGQTLVFHALGDIYRVGIDGGPG